jgi:uncharacterized Zn-binding protein involved in type VI secretion
MPKVTVNPPKTPITKGSNGIAAAVTPNMCKMPGPPAPFVPAPLPNIGKSGMSPDGYSTSVTIEGNAVAIQGATFKSMGDVASKGLGGGLVSMNTEGPTKFVAPGSTNVQIEGKAVQFLGDAMVNNCDPGGQTPNGGATTPGEVQPPGPPGLEATLVQIAKDCEDEVENDPNKPKSCRERGTLKHKCADRKLNEATKNDNPKSVYSDGAFDGKTGSPILKNNPMKGGVPGQVPRSRGAIVNQAIGLAVSKGMDVGGTIRSMLSGKQFPDVVVAADATQPPGKGNTAAIYDFKFPCPKEKKPSWGQGQQDRYRRLLTPSSPPSMVSPMGIF